MVYIYATDEQINLFAIGYMIKHTLNNNKVFIEKVEKILRATFHQNNMEGIRNHMRKNDTCIISLIMFHESLKKSNKSV